MSKIEQEEGQGAREPFYKRGATQGRGEGDWSEGKYRVGRHLFVSDVEGERGQSISQG
jgi:hypothetical protein